LFTGICYALFFVFLIHPRIPLPNSTGGNVTKALLFAFVLATLSAARWVPQLFNEKFATDLGWFSQNVGKLLGTAAWKPIVGIYLWHFIWGLNLGLVYNPLPPEDY
jgi:hypothetical protein